MRRDPVRLEEEREEPYAWILVAGLGWVSGAVLALTACGQMPPLAYGVSLLAGLAAICVGRWP